MLLCNLLLRVVSDDVTTMCEIHDLNREWRRLISSTPKFALFCVVKHWLRAFRDHRHRGWFESKVFSKYKQCVQLFSTLAICPPHTLLQFLVTLIPNLSTYELVQLKSSLKEANYEDLDPKPQEIVRIYFPPNVRLFRLTERGSRISGSE